jgi:hypothetical protein
MSRITLAACVATIAIAVPAGWHVLDADIPTNGKLLRPLQASVELGDGVKITLDVDRSVITTGDSVVASLRAYADTPKNVAVDVAVFQTEENEGSRVDNPATLIDREHLQLTAAPGGGPVQKTKLVLGARRSNAARLETFRIYATTRGGRVPTNSWDSGADDEKAPSAAVGVIGWSGDSLRLAMKTEGPVRGDDSFVVAVRVKNPNPIPVPRPRVRLGTQVTTRGDVETPEDVAIEQIDEAYERSTLAPGASMVAKFKVTPKEAPTAGAFTFLATAQSYDSEGTEWKLVAGAMDVRRFTVAREKAPTLTSAR